MIHMEGPINSETEIETSVSTEAVPIEVSGTKNKRVKIKNVICIVLAVLMLPILIIGGTMVVKSIANPGEPPDFMGYMPLVIKNNEGIMEGTPFENNSVIIFKKVNEDTELSVNDIICYWEKESIHTQTIKEIELTEDGPSYTVGNPDDETDSKKLSESNTILGKYQNHVGGIGGFIEFTGTTAGMICFIAVPMCLFFVFLLI